ncbi:MAG: ATP-binding cassette domain-containing protein [Gammaproteobacteria bacterium]|nr:ATP-binding cassette domain-containing protein [Gammaproteobacteria bacterium]MYL00157.1 ATP-binding cassette domain-containing protein [Gammaproteobacteria bacterium]
MEHNGPPLIRLENVGRRYRAGDAEVGALKGVTLDIHAGEFVAVMGPSGSGKTTLMNIIGCLDQPSDGEYFYSGLPVHAAGSDERARLRREAFGFVFQDYNLLRMVTAQENVEMPAIYAGTRRRIRWARAAELLSTLGLAHRTGHHPNELSGGERQRVAIGRALMNGAAVVLADEPTGSVDSRNGKEIMAQLAALSERGRTVILVTHDPTVARYARRRIELLDGRVTSDTGPNPGRQVSAARSARAPSQRIQAPVASLAESARTARRTLRGNKSRTALTLLGIVIGVFSVTAMLGVAQGMRNSLTDTIRQLGGAGITISPRFGENSRPLTLSDADAIRSQIPNLLSVAPEMSGGGTLVGGNNSQFARVTATTGRAMQERGLILAEGAFFDEAHSESYAPVVILGGLLAGDLFGERARAVGEYVLINGEPYQVIGVLKRNESTFGAFDFQQRSAHVPLMTGAARLFGRDNLDSIQVVAADTDQVETVQNAIEALLSRLHGRGAFRIANQEQILEAQNNIGRIGSLVFGAIGGISLVVAGIGVMNIMLASVAERTREIGLRMAIGARERDILMQFICEAAMVAGLGGAVGLIAALGLGALVNSFTPMAFVAFTPWILLVGLSCATLTGVIFGFAPARRAAGMDPVAALRA